MRRFLIFLMASGLAIACGSLSVIVYTVFLTPERPRAPTPTIIAIKPAEPTGTPRGEARPLFTPTPAEPAPSPTPVPTRPAPTATIAPTTPPATPTVAPTAPPPPPTAAPTAVPAPPKATPPTTTATRAPAAAPTSAPPPPARTPTPTRPAPTATRPAPTPTQPVPTPARPAPTSTPTQPAPTATATRPPTASPTSRPARLSVSPNRLALRPGQRGVVTLNATAGPPLTWRAVAEVPWLAVAPASGVLRDDPGVLTIEMRQPGPPAKVNEGRVIVEAGGERAVVIVTLAAATP